jgi:LysM repeat protein
MFNYTQRFNYRHEGRLGDIWTESDGKNYTKNILPDIRQRRIEHLAKPEIQQRIKEKNIKIKPEIQAEVDKLLAARSEADRLAEEAAKKAAKKAARAKAWQSFKPKCGWGAVIAGLLAVGYVIYASNKSKDDSITPEAADKAAADKAAADQAAADKAAADKAAADKAAADKAAADKAAADQAAAQYTTRIVQNGETLTSLARKYDIDVETIKTLNQEDKLKKGTYFLVGEEIKLPASAKSCDDCKESKETIQEYIDKIVARHRAKPFTQKELDKYLDRAHQRQYNLEPKAA